MVQALCALTQTQTVHTLQHKSPVSMQVVGNDNTACILVELAVAFGGRLNGDLQSLPDSQAIASQLSVGNGLG